MTGYNPIARQAGMSGASWFMVIVLVFGAASIALRLLPHYLDHGSVDTEVRALLDSGEMASLTVSQVHRTLEQRLKLNNIRDFETKDKLEIDKGNGNVRMTLAYEVREHLFWNIDVVLSFEEQYEKVL